MEIRLDFRSRESREIRSVSVTMRTPGHDFELAAGFLYSEGILQRREQVREITYCRSLEAPQEYNVVTVGLRDGEEPDPDLLTRNFYTTSSCGVCGKASLEAVQVKGARPLDVDGFRMPASRLSRLPETLRESQPAFRETGGLHAAGLFDAEGDLVELREDVGRHNAVDKVVGRAFLDDRLPLTERVLVVSGRTSFEILQKALAAGIPMVVAVGAPSSLAVELARRFNMTLSGFTRDRGFNLYAGFRRVPDWSPEET